MIRAELRISRTVNRWAIDVRYFWTQLWGYCDDFGRGRYDAKVILADTFPIDDAVTTSDITKWMRTLERSGVIHRYEVDGRLYFECVSWEEHQPMRYQRKTRIPDPFGKVPQSSAKFRKVSHEEEGDREGDTEGEVSTKPPSPFCGKHPSGTTDPCRACGNARKARTEWDAKPKPSNTKAYKRGDGHTCADNGYGYCSKCQERM